MILKFNYGFEYKKFHYGWYNKELYRLPSSTFGRKHGLKKMDIIPIGNKTGYCCVRKKFTIDQLKGMTKPINVEISIFESVDIPA